MIDARPLHGMWIIGLGKYKVHFLASNLGLQSLCLCQNTFTSIVGDPKAPGTEGLPEPDAQAFWLGCFGLSRATPRALSLGSLCDSLFGGFLNISGLGGIKLPILGDVHARLRRFLMFKVEMTLHGGFHSISFIGFG